MGSILEIDVASVDVGVYFHHSCALWVAAIAPLPVQRDLESMVEIPTFRTSYASTLRGGNTSTAIFLFGDDGSQWLVNQGVFSFETRNQGALRDSARANLTMIDGKIKRAKLNKAGFVYEDRYGIGAGAGFTETHDAKAPDSY
jgi:hypothetical protein